MKLKSLAAIVVTALSVMNTNTAQASDGTITFAGTVVATACSITGGSSFTVTLPPVDATALSSTGKTAAPTPFNIIMTGCPASTAVHALFEISSSVDTSTGNLKNTGTAGLVQIGLLNSSLQAINIATQANNGSGTGVTTTAGGAATLAYYAQYVATGAATSGTVASTVTYSISYN